MDAAAGIRTGFGSVQRDLDRGVLESGISQLTWSERNRTSTVNILIAKLGATGDVVRTTPLLRRLSGDITWVTAAKNTVLLAGLRNNLRCLAWEERTSALDTHFDLVINLEDTLEVAQFLETVPCSET